MFRKSIITLVVSTGALLSGFAAAAQVTEETQSDTRGRVCAEIDRSIAHGLHVQASGEFRMKDSFKSIDRIYTGLGITYKPINWLKLGLGYIWMNIDDGGVWEMRHRVNADATLSYRTGFWKFSLRERLQCTYRPGEMNLYQNPRMELNLRSRAKISYAFPDIPIEPYFAAELRNTLNGTVFNAPAHSSVPGDNVSFNDMYINRLRFEPGISWKIDARNGIDFFVLYDKTFKKKFDADKNGDLKYYKDKDGNVVYNESTGMPLFKIMYRKENLMSFGIGYKYSF